MRRAVFLDRDGVLNLPALRAAGFMLIVVTNQPDVARGWVRREVVEGMHRLLRAALPLDDIKVCWDVDGPANTCYKPKPGLLLEAAREHGIDLVRSFMVGDRWRDVGAGRAAGCFTVFIDRAYAEPLTERPDAVCADLAGAAAVIFTHAQHAGAGGPR
jgi:D-glycero-D-manno-heptose 1,7-bisphosphate phosphatase